MLISSIWSEQVVDLWSIAHCPLNTQTSCSWSRSLSASLFILCHCDQYSLISSLKTLDSERQDSTELSKQLNYVIVNVRGGRQQKAFGGVKEDWHKDEVLMNYWSDLADDFLSLDWETNNTSCYNNTLLSRYTGGVHSLTDTQHSKFL